MRDTCLLDTILEPGGLSVSFQPIFEARQKGWSLHALECLIRGPKGTNVEKADVLFEYVRRKQEESLVDRACIATALHGASRLPGSPNLCINVHASALVKDPELPGYLESTTEECSISPSRLTIEIIEHVPFWDGPKFLRALEKLRNIGMKIALDDVGLGQSNYRMILDSRPDYLKVDRYIINGTHVDYYRQAVLESILHLAMRFGCRVVAEGVETIADLDAVLALGVELLQGYLFSPALPDSELINTDFLQGDFVSPVLRPPAINPSFQDSTKVCIKAH